MCMTMGEIIKKLRLDADMTQEDLGKQLGVQKSAVRKWEKGEVENIKRNTIQDMAKVFKVSPCYLMGWEDAYNPNGRLADEVKLIEKTELEKAVKNYMGTDAVQLLQLFSKLNEQGKAKAIGNLLDLTEIQKYTENEDTDFCSK